MGIIDRIKMSFGSWDGSVIVPLVQSYGELPKKGKIFPVKGYGLRGQLLQVSIQTDNYKGVFDVDISKKMVDGGLGRSKIKAFELINIDTVELYFDNED